MSEDRPKIYYVWNYREWGGAQIHLISIMKNAGEGWDITVLLPAGSGEELIRYLNEVPAKLHYLKRSIDLSDARSVLAKVRRQVSRLLSEAEILRTIHSLGCRRAIVHIEAAPWQSWKLITLLRSLGARVFITSHNTLTDGPWWRRVIWKARLRFLCSFGLVHSFAANLDTFRRMSEWYPRSYMSQVPITYTAIDQSEIEQLIKDRKQRTPARRQAGIPDDECLVLCVGQFIERKGRRIFLECAEKIAALRSDVRFAWLSPAEPDDEGKELIGSFKLRNRFHFIRSTDVGKSRKELLAFISSADIFALPSLREGLPIALLEAMALGVPSISTNVNSIPEAIIDRETGLLIEPGDSGSLAKAILVLIENAELKKAIAEKGKRHVLSKFNEREVSKIVLQSYRQALA
jgi:glycosyltransferase involved in cell wall biosynthesis